MSEVPLTLLDSSPYVVLMYLLFLLLSKALDRLNKGSRKNRGTGRDSTAGTADEETKTDLGA